MLFDFGATAPYIFRDELGMDFKDIDAVYITHCHADHVGGMEMLAFSRYFIPKLEDGVPVRPKLFMMKSLMKELWDYTLRGGLESVQGRIMNLTDYFDCRPVTENKSFIWEGYTFTPSQTVHIRSGYIIKNSYGLMIHKLDKGERRRDKTALAYITSDSQFDRGLLEYYDKAAIIFQDCETGPHKSNVHAHYSDLNTLPEGIKNKMWLYHYGQVNPDFQKDGFAGFVEKGQEFKL